jgi:Holliday junction resolvase
MDSNSNQFPTDQTARLIHEALEQLGWQSDSQALADRVRRLDLGLPAEDEFSMLLSWMGKCQLVHKLDEAQSPPESKGTYRVPDLLAIFDYNGQPVATLIEVKATASKSLSWRPDYYEGLRLYGEHIGLPVLVAWKRKPLECWALFELAHFNRSNRNYKITICTAMKQNLMCVLAGDFGVVLRKGVGLHLEMRNEVSIMPNQQQLPESWNAVIENAYFTNANGNLAKKLGLGLWPLFLAAPLEERTDIKGTHTYHSFVVPDEDSMQWAHCTLAVLVNSKTDKNRQFRWRDILLQYRVPVDFSILKSGASDGIAQNIVQCVIHARPPIMPDFL